MKKSLIQITVDLDEQNIPENIVWDATDKEEPGPEETKSFSLAIWDHHQKNTLRIDLWTKQMPVDEMKRFYLECMAGLSQSLLRSTGDEVMARHIDELCNTLAEHLRNKQS